MVHIFEKKTLKYYFSKRSCCFIFIPNCTVYRRRCLISGNFVCGLIGIAFSMFNSGFAPNSVMLSLAVGLSIFAMVVLAIEHPPAGGTVIALLFTPDYVAFVTLLLLSSILTLFVRFLKPYMINLM